MHEFIKIFIAGIALGNGPCLFICIPVVLPYICGLPQPGAGSCGWKTGLKLAVIFSISRLAAYSMLGSLAVFFYRSIFRFIGTKGIYLQLALGILVILTGVFYLLSIKSGLILSNPLCGLLRRKTLEGARFNMILLGLLIGFSPCAPLLAILTYIAATAKDPLSGLLAGFSFGLGTLITPLIPLGTLGGFMADKAKKHPVIFAVVRIVSAAFLIYFGALLITRSAL